MNKNKKNLYKVTANVLGLTLVSAMTAGTAAEALTPVSVYAAQTVQNVDTQKLQSVKKVYLDGTAKTAEDGTTKEKAVTSLEQALEKAGENGTVMVCGTVTVSSEKTVSVPSGIRFERNQGFTGSMIRITGSGKLSVTGGNLRKEDVDCSSADLGEQAFVQMEKEEKQEGKVSVPDTVVLKSREEWKDYDFSGHGFLGEGRFFWESQEAPSAYQSQAVVVFQPSDTEKYDYTKVPGWNEKSGTVTRKVQVTIEELKPEEEEKEEPETPAEKEPGAVSMVSVVLKTREEWGSFDFQGAGFQGNGSFAWGQENPPEEYESQVPVVFTPADADTKDYSQIQGWNPETGTVVQKVLVRMEALSLPEEEKPETPEVPEVPEKNEPGDETEQDTGDTGKEDGQDSSEENGENPAQEPSQGDKTELPEESDPVEEKDDEKENPSDTVITDVTEGEQETEKEEIPQEQPDFAAETGKTGEEATELPEEVIPVGSLMDEATGVRVEGDFLPFYVDLRVDAHYDPSQLPDAGIGDVLSAYEIELWDLKEEEAYQLPQGKKVTVRIPLPENAGEFSGLSIAHYLGNNQYEYFSYNEDGTGTMRKEELDGMEYLVFETASFSPFHVGGHPLVGPGSKEPEKQPSQGDSSGNGSQTSPSSQGQSNIPSNLGSSSAGSSSESGQKVNKADSSSQKTRVIRTVKTGDDAPVLVYVAVGAAAVILAAIAFLLGKRKK